MATLLEKDLNFIPTYGGGSYLIKSLRELPLNNSVIGNLTTSTNTADYFRVPTVKSKTVVRVRFDVEQQVNEFDYYILESSLGPLYYGPDSNKNQFKDGIFLALTGAAEFAVKGSINGVFKGNYTLEVVEVAPVQGVTYATTKAGNRSAAEEVPLSGIITGWGKAGADLFGVKFVVPKGESGKLQFKFSEQTNHLELGSPSSETLSPKSSQALFHLNNEGGRRLLSETVKYGESMTSPLLSEGTYFLDVYLLSYGGYAAINYFIETAFQSTATQSTPTITKSSLIVLVDKGVLDSKPVVLRGLTEEVTSNGSTVTSHLIIYNGVKFNYADVDALVSTVVRNGNFTDEFRNEILDLAPNLKDVKYEDLVKIVGTANIDNVILNVAGADGNFVG